MLCKRKLGPCGSAIVSTFTVYQLTLVSCGELGHCRSQVLLYEWKRPHVLEQGFWIRISDHKVPYCSGKSLKVCGGVKCTPWNKWQQWTTGSCVYTITRLSCKEHLYPVHRTPDGSTNICRGLTESTKAHIWRLRRQVWDMSGPGESDLRQRIPYAKAPELSFSFIRTGLMDTAVLHCEK